MELGITQPHMAYRFRLAKCQRSITQNVETVEIENVAKTIKIKVRSTILGNDYADAVAFADNRSFVIDALDGMGNPYFVIKPLELVCTSHLTSFEYGNSGTLYHYYEFKYDYMGVFVSEDEQPNVLPMASDPNFPSIAEAMAELEKKVTSAAEQVNKDDLDKGTE
jgi:hypothetical protein